MYDILELSKKLLPELKDIAKELKIKKAESLKKQDLIYKILDQQAIQATDATITSKAKKEEIHSSPEVGNHASDSLKRRGKRPRTLIPILKRPKESVMSVSPDEEVLLAGLIKSGDTEALRKLVKANLRFVVTVAKQ